MKSKRRNKTNTVLLITSALMLLLTFVVLLFNFQFWVVNDNIGNLYVRFSDFSKTKENHSCRIIFDDSIIYEIGNISESKTKRFKLLNGLHKVEISDLNNRFYLKDSIFIKNYPEENNLFISFDYKPSYEEYLPEFKKIYFDRLIKRVENKCTDEDKELIWKKVNQKINIEFLKRTNYKPIERKFEINFYDEPIYIL